MVFVIHILTFLFGFLIIYLLYLFIIVLRKKGLNKFKTSKQLEYFQIKFKLDFDKINIKSFANTLALTNAFIIGLTLAIVGLVDNFILKLMIAFIILMPLIYIIYNMIGRHYKKKEGK